MASNTVGSQNAANGAGALFNNTMGNGNTANGFQALNFNSVGTGNTAIGSRRSCTIPQAATISPWALLRGSQLRR